jgi:hypothetical protein
LAAEKDLRIRSGKAGEQQTCSQGEAKQSEQSLNRHQRVGREPLRTDAAITDGCESLHPEEKGFQEAICGRCGSRTVERLRAAGQIGESKQQIGAEIEGGNGQKEMPPNAGQCLVRPRRHPKSKLGNETAGDLGATMLLAGRMVSSE